MIFFGERGLTSTSANHIANVAKESYAETEMALSSIKFFDESVSLLYGGDPKTLSVGCAGVSDIDEMLDRIAKTKALIAWLREAMKAKQNLMNEVNTASFEYYEIECPDVPVREKYLTQDEIIAKWNVKKRNRYYYLDTLCATIGQAIHPNGAVSKARTELHDIINNPRVTSGSGRDMVIFLRTPSVETESVEKMYMQLQNKYREAQAELNSMKNEIEETIQKDVMKKDSEYSEACSEYRNRMSVLNAKLSEMKGKDLGVIQKLKIVIPDSLRQTYEFVSSLGK